MSRTKPTTSPSTFPYWARVSWRDAQCSHHARIGSELAEWQEDRVYDSAETAGVAVVIVDELRWTVPYPEGIRPEVRNLDVKRR
jgi:hypothetical protein